MKNKLKEYQESVTGQHTHTYTQSTIKQDNILTYFLFERAYVPFLSSNSASIEFFPHLANTFIRMKSTAKIRQNACLKWERTLRPVENNVEFRHHFIIFPSILCANMSFVCWSFGRLRCEDESLMYYINLRGKENLSEHHLPLSRFVLPCIDLIYRTFATDVFLVTVLFLFLSLHYTGSSSGNFLLYLFDVMCTKIRTEILFGW